MMYAADRDALICDMAETYHILDIHAIPVPLLAILASGLRDNSRIKAVMSGRKLVPPEYEIALIHDILAHVFNNGQTDPFLLSGIVLGEGKKETDSRGFDTKEEYESYRKKVIEGVRNG